MALLAPSPLPAEITSRAGISPAPNRLWELFTTSRIISLGSMMPRPCRLVHRLRTTTVAGLVPLLLAASVSACATRSSRPAVPADTQPASLNLWSSAPVGEWSPRRSRAGRHPDHGATV